MDENDIQTEKKHREQAQRLTRKADRIKIRRLAIDARMLQNEANKAIAATARGF